MGRCVGGGRRGGRWLRLNIWGATHFTLSYIFSPSTPQLYQPVGENRFYRIFKPDTPLTNRAKLKPKSLCTRGAQCSSLLSVVCRGLVFSTTTTSLPLRDSQRSRSSHGPRWRGWIWPHGGLELDGCQPGTIEPDPDLVLWGNFWLPGKAGMHLVVLDVLHSGGLGFLEMGVNLLVWRHVGTSVLHKFSTCSKLQHCLSMILLVHVCNFGSRVLSCFYATAPFTCARRGLELFKHRLR